MTDEKMVTIVLCVFLLCCLGGCICESWTAVAKEKEKTIQMQLQVQSTNQMKYER